MNHWRQEGPRENKVPVWYFAIPDSPGVRKDQTIICWVIAVVPSDPVNRETKAEIAQNNQPFRPDSGLHVEILPELKRNAGRGRRSILAWLLLFRLESSANERMIG
jgi:hypothetical protein